MLNVVHAASNSELLASEFRSNDHLSSELSYGPGIRVCPFNLVAGCAIAADAAELVWGQFLEVVVVRTYSSSSEAWLPRMGPMKA
ncbi:hypothetical protein T492DRAFT_1082899 [Pavlovales sp. CCMP2436]|nr:hypothetical protein T492DRAFT_1082899 [Pavlovales sp. CCMP2436]